MNVKYRQANRADHQWLVAIWNKTTIKSASHSLCAHTCQSLLDDSLCNPSFYFIRTTARPYFQAIEQQWIVSVTKMWTLTFYTGFIPKQASVLLTISWEIYGTGAIFPVPFPFYSISEISRIEILCIGYRPLQSSNINTKTLTDFFLCLCLVTFASLSHSFHHFLSLKIYQWFGSPINVILTHIEIQYKKTIGFTSSAECKWVNVCVCLCFDAGHHKVLVFVFAFI